MKALSLNFDYRIKCTETVTTRTHDVIIAFFLCRERARSTPLRCDRTMEVKKRRRIDSRVDEMLVCSFFLVLTEERKVLAVVHSLSIITKQSIRVADSCASDAGTRTNTRTITSHSPTFTPQNANATRPVSPRLSTSKR